MAYLDRNCVRGEVERFRLNWYDSQLLNDAARKTTKQGQSLNAELVLIGARMLLEHPEKFPHLVKPQFASVVAKVDATVH